MNDILLYKRFGCDDKFNGMTYDECGVCGGDNSTCTVVSQVFTQTQSKGEVHIFSFIIKLSRLL